MKTQYLVSVDGTRIAYDYWHGSEEGILLVHQLPSNKSSWAPLAPVLVKEGYTVMTIDYRGRGESGGQLSVPIDFQNIGLDVDAAIIFLRSKGVKRIIIIGASIGANHALLAMQRHSDVTGAVLLSPGLDYRGVKTENAARAVTKALLIVASEDDSYSAQSAKQLHTFAQDSSLILYDKAGHGTDMFVESKLTQELVNFVVASLPPRGFLE